jgi:hypothetical protein
MILFGMTGTGKSTEQKNILLQFIQKGFGVCFIDPKGDAVKEFVQEIPEWREDDIIYIEPGSKEFDRVVGLNFLETSHEPGDPAYDREVTSIVNDLTAILKGGEYWGPKMEEITTNIARAMIRSELNFTLLDMYYVLLEDESRQAFANRVADEGFENIHQYTKRIAEMDYEEVDAVVRRIQSWVEDPISRGIVAHREGTVNLTEAVDDQKIILVDVSVDSTDIKEVVTTAIMRRIWAAIKARDEDEEDRPPFITLIDEFDDVATAEMNIEKMLSKARAGKMGVALACQNPSQIEADSVREQMFGNARTLNTFGLGDPPDAELVAKRLGDTEYDDIIGLPDYNVITRILMETDEGPQVSDPLPVKTFPDYPPIRSAREADQLIDRSLEQYGVEPLDEPLEEASMLIHDLGNSNRIRRAFLESVWEAHVQLEQEYVSMRAINRRFRIRTGQDIAAYPQGIHVSADHCTAVGFLLYFV